MTSTERDSPVCGGRSRPRLAAFPPVAMAGFRRGGKRFILKELGRMAPDRGVRAGYPPKAAEAGGQGRASPL